MTRFYPARAFFKVITNENNIKEIDYIVADKEGNLYIEKHIDDNIEKIKLEESNNELC